MTIQSTDSLGDCEVNYRDKLVLTPQTGHLIVLLLLLPLLLFFL
jgi:hypothetical protein